VDILGRAWRIALPIAAAAGAGTIAVLLALAPRPGLGVTSAGAASSFALGTAVQPPRQAPALRLVGERGSPTSLAAFRGRWLVLAPAMTLCHEVCPMTTAVLIELEGLLRRDGLARKVAVAEVTVDPWRDTPKRLRAYRRLSGADFDLLTGTQAEIRAIWRFFGVYYQRVPQGNPPDVDWMTHRPETFDVQHTDGVFILDPRGRERIVDEGMAQVARPMPAALRRLLDAEGLHDLAHPQFPWTAQQVLRDLARLMGRGRLAADAAHAAAAAGPAGAVRAAAAAAPAETLGAGASPGASSAARARGSQQGAGGVALNGSPAALAALRAQAGRLLGGYGALRARLRSLRGHPVVVNAWASWCPPCRAELPLFASVSAVTGGEVAFLGADTDDTPAAARAFLAKQRLDYPSYQVSLDSLEQLAAVEGTPSTLFIDPRGQVVYVHIGEYPDRAALEADVERYALGREQA